MSFETKTVPFNPSAELPIADQVKIAQAQAAEYFAQPTMSIDEAAAMYNPQEFTAAEPEIQPFVDVIALQPAIEVNPKSLRNRISAQFNKVSESLKSVFQKEADTPVEKNKRRSLVRGAVGAVALSLVMSVATSATPQSPSAEQVGSTTPKVTAIAYEVSAPDQSSTNVAEATNQSLVERAKVIDFTEQQPQAAADFFNWVHDAHQEQPGITDEEMADQFKRYTSPDKTVASKISFNR